MKRIVTRTVSLVLALLFLVISTSCGNVPAKNTDDPYIGTGIYTLYDKDSIALSKNDKYSGVIETKDIAEKEVTMYKDARYETAGKNVKTGKINIAFFKDMPSVPYISVDEAFKNLKEMYKATPGYDKYDLTVKPYKDYIEVSRENDISVFFNIKENTITFNDYDKFCALPGTKSSIDLISLGIIEPQALIKHDDYTDIAGAVITIRLDDYGIHMIRNGSALYVPLQTINDLFVCDAYINWVYNGKDVFEVATNSLSSVDAMLGESSLTELGEIYYNVEGKGDRPDDLVLFTYRELCLALDFHYGLKEEHDITNFNEYFNRTGLVYKLMSNDPDTFYTAIVDIVKVKFADGHSAESNAGPFVTDPFSLEFSMVSSVSGASLMQAYFKYIPARASKGLSGPYGYYETGDTAFISFDQFSFDPYKDYTNCELKNDPSDTVMLLLYSHSQIKRENSPVKNVVVDLSCNVGGAVDAAASLISWYLNIGTLVMEDMTTKAKSTNIYRFDANRDGVFDSEDQLGNDIKRFCLVSPLSFSCANLCPSAFKASDNVVLLGKTTGGGACVVQPLSTADGCIFQCSGRLRINTVKNGAFYSVDKGVDPDFVISDPTNLYDREFIVSLIHDIK